MSGSLRKASYNTEAIEALKLTTVYSLTRKIIVCNS